MEVTYDPAKVSYGQLLKVFFSVAHDPTQLNRQGPDHGTQYRSAIFTTGDEQKRVAQAYVAQLDRAKVFAASDRDGDRRASGVLSGGGVSPELSGAASDAAVHRVQRPAEARESQDSFSRSLHRQLVAKEGANAPDGEKRNRFPRAIDAALGRMRSLERDY